MGNHLRDDYQDMVQSMIHVDNFHDSQFHFLKIDDVLRKKAYFFSILRHDVITVVPFAMMKKKGHVGEDSRQNKKILSSMERMDIN